MIRIKGYGLLIGLAFLLVFSACGGSGNGGGNGSTSTRVTMTLSADPTSIPADGVSASNITAKLVNSRDASPVADGTAVTFSLETSIGGTVNPTAVTTTVAGVATAIVTAGDTAGTITVKALSGTVSKTLPLTITEYTPGQPETTNLVLSQVWAVPASIPIYGETQVYAEVRDNLGNLAIDGTEVTFATSLMGGLIDASSTTVGGLALATLSASSFPSWSEGATITVKAGKATDQTLKIKVLNLNITQITASASPIPVNGTAKITVEVRDTAQNLALDDTPVAFSTSLLGSSITPLVKTAGGVAEATFTGGNSSGTAIITVQVGSRSLSTINVMVGISGATVTASAHPDRISIGKTSIVEVEVTSGGILAPDGTPVDFSTDLIGATITPESKTSSGIAQATFTSGTKGGTATITIKCGDVTVRNVVITVVGDVTTIKVYASPLTIAVYENSSISADVRDATGNPVVDGTLVNFSTDKSSATFSKPQVETANGLANTTFTAGASYGNAKITVDSGGIKNDSRIITISAPQVSSIQFISATPDSVGVKGSGLTEVSTVTFTVKDDHGNTAPDGTVVNFSIYGPKGGEYITPLQTSTTTGTAITHLQSGTVSGPVRIEASTVNNLTSSSVGIAIGSGLPSYRNFSVAIQNGAYNMTGLDCYGLQTNITAFLADRFYNYVAKNTSANFYTEAGAISPTAWSDKTGQAVAIYQTQGPAPRDVGPAAFYECEGGDNPLFPCAPERSSTDYLYGPHQTFNPRDGVSTILVTTIGEEEFVDLNGNGIYDAGEPFIDLSEPFLDANDNGVYDYAEPFTDGVDITGVSNCTLTPNAPGCWPSKINGKYDPPTPWMDVNLSDNPDGDGLSGECDGMSLLGEDSGKVGNNSVQVVMTGATMANLPVIPGTVQLYDETNPANYIVDDGMGKISTLAKVNRAVIDYATGKITGTVTFAKTIGVGNKVRLNYEHGTADCNNRWDKTKICLGDLENPNSAVDCKTNPNTAGCVCFPGEKFLDKWLPGQTHGDGMRNDAEFYVDYNQNGKFDGPNKVWDAHTMIWRSVNQLITGVQPTIQIYKLDPKTQYASFCGPGSDYSPGDDCYYPLAVTIPSGHSNYYLLEVSDVNFNPLDKLNISLVGNGLKVSTGSWVSDDPISQNWTHFIFSVYDADPTTSTPASCSVDIKIQWADCKGGVFSETHTLTGHCE